MSVLNTAISGLKAQQEAIKTTGHNISNANTPGYSRQEVVVDTRNPLFRGFGYVGQGVNIDAVRRITDQFMITQQRTDTSTFQELDAFKTNIEQVDRLLASEDTGLQPRLDAFFASLQGAADNPAYIPSRDVVLGEVEGVVDRFHTLHNYLTNQNKTVNGQITSTVDQINSIAEGIAELNQRIVSARGSATRHEPNDLLDKRDELVRQLSELVSVEVTEDNGHYNVSFGQGQALVLAQEANRLEAVPGEKDPSQTGVRFVSQFDNVFITDKLESGRLKGLVDFREQSLNPAMNQMGRIAVGLVQEFNAQHRQGLDLNGNFGGDVFRDLNDPELAGQGRVQASALNEPPRDQTFSVYFEEPGALTTSDYELRLTGPDSGSYEVIRGSDGEVVDDGTLEVGNLPTEISFDGLRVVLENGTFNAGDKFTIKPLRDVADQMEQVLKEPSELALAYPMKADTSLGNEGSGVIDQGTMLSRDGDAFSADGDLNPPLLIRFDSETRYSILDNSDPGNPVSLEPPLENIRYVPGANNTIFTDDPGETLVSSWRPRLPQDPTITADGPSVNPPYNGINSERFTFSRTDSQTGEVTEDPVIRTPTGATANEIATELNQVEGVQARAYTKVQLSNFTNSGTPYDPDNPFEVWVNGHEITVDDLGPNQSIFEDDYPDEMPDELGPNFLADRINAHYDLQDAGIRAKSDGETLTITDANGNDIFVEMRGDKPQSVLTGPPPPATPGAIDPGDTFDISTGEQWPVEPIAGETRGKLNNRTGFDFSQDGPYLYEMYLPDGRKGTIELTGDHATGDDVKAEVEAKIEALLDSPGRVEATITPEGGIEYQTFIKMEGTGNDDTAGMNVGGQVDVTMADGISLDTEPKAGAIFTGVSEAKPTYQGFQFNISGRPEAGDEFTINWNGDGVSDNRNALDLVGLETTNTLNDRQGGMTFTEAYSQAVERIGTRTNQAQIRADSAEAVLEGTEADLNAVRGVNLDEEAARLIEFQLAYQANAQVVSIAQDTFNSLMGAFR